MGKMIMCLYAPPNFYVKSKIIGSHDFQQRLFPSEPFASEIALTLNTSILNDITLVFYWKLVLILLVPQHQSRKLQLSAQSHKLPFLQRSVFSACWYISQPAIQRRLLVLLNYWLDNISPSLGWPKIKELDQFPQMSKAREVASLHPKSPSLD